MKGQACIANILYNKPIAYKTNLHNYIKKFINLNLLKYLTSGNLEQEEIILLFAIFNTKPNLILVPI